MIISDLITILIEKKNQYGDLPVATYTANKIYWDKTEFYWTDDIVIDVENISIKKSLYQRKSCDNEARKMCLTLE